MYKTMLYILFCIILYTLYLHCHALRIFTTNSNHNRIKYEYQNRLLSGTFTSTSKHYMNKNSNEVTLPALVVRVSNQINIPIRKQIARAKAYKSSQNTLSSSSALAKTTKFSKKKLPKNDTDAGIEDTDTDYSKIKPDVYFVDGYNIIGYMNRQDGASSVDMEALRDLLISDLSVVSGANGWAIEVIFDAYKSSSLSGKQSSSSEVNGIKVTYTSASETADSHIERRFYDLKMQGYTNMVVVTDDNLLRMLAGSEGLALGYLSAEMLVEEINLAYLGWENVQTEMNVIASKNKPTTINIMNIVSDNIKEVFIEMKEKEKLALQDDERKRMATQKAIIEKKENDRRNRNNNKALLEQYTSNHANIKSETKKLNKWERSNSNKKPTIGGLLSSSMRAMIIDQMKKESDLMEEQARKEKEYRESQSYLDEREAALLKKKHEIEMAMSKLQHDNATAVSATVNSNTDLSSNAITNAATTTVSSSSGGNASTNSTITKQKYVTVRFR